MAPFLFPEADLDEKKPLAFFHAAFVWYCEECDHANFEYNSHFNDVSCEKCETKHEVKW